MTDESSQPSNGVDAGKTQKLSRERDGLQAMNQLKVISGTFASEIPPKQTAYHEGISPEITWDEVPGARSYALIVEDPDAHKVKPFVHWVAYNIPGDVTSLAEGLGGEGLLEGKTSAGSVGYFGPKPPEGDPPHHYHFQVFALDKELEVAAGAERDAVLAAMKGHVLASGELVGTYQQPRTDEHIGAEGTEAPGEAPRSGEAHLANDQEQRDASLANSFPASDPVPPKHIDDGSTDFRRNRKKSG